jgi:nucleoside-diphosphate-sugar epimerase
MAQDQFFDISKAKRVLGWAPKYTLTEALKETIAFLKDEYL